MEDHTEGGPAMLPGLIHYSDLEPGDDIAVTLVSPWPHRKLCGFWGGNRCRGIDGEPGGFVLFLYDESAVLRRMFFPCGNTPDEMTSWCNLNSLRRRDPKAAQS